MKETELKPCPFCGGNAVLEYFKSRKGYEATIQCNGECVLYMSTITHDTEQEAIEAVTRAWNRRADNVIDEKVLVEMIKEHKKNVRCNGAFVNEIYGMAHDHIINLIEILAKRTTKGADNE